MANSGFHNDQELFKLWLMEIFFSGKRLQFAKRTITIFNR